MAIVPQPDRPLLQSRRLTCGNGGSRSVPLSAQNHQSTGVRRKCCYFVERRRCRTTPICTVALPVESRLADVHFVVTPLLASDCSRSTDFISGLWPYPQVGHSLPWASRRAGGLPGRQLIFSARRRQRRRRWRNADAVVASAGRQKCASACAAWRRHVPSME